MLEKFETNFVFIKSSMFSCELESDQVALKIAQHSFLLKFVVLSVNLVYAFKLNYFWMLFWKVDIESLQ